MSRKQPRNAYYYFMLDFKETRKFKSLKEVAEAASPHWKNLTKEQRKVYEDRAKAARNDQSKLNSDKQCVDEIEEIERRQWEFKQQMKDEIISNLEMIKRKNVLTSHMFFIIHVNSYCQHDHTKEYSPCEIAIAGFSLRDGVLSENVYHSMINPGPLPLGYANIAQQHANETHQIELPRCNGSESENQEEIFAKIVEFLSGKNRIGSERLPIMYAVDKNLSMVTDVINTWCGRFGFNEDLFRIYNLQYFFRNLRNMVAGREVWTSDTMSYQEIEKDVYSYYEEIACDFHQVADVLNYCSRSIVIRFAYVICDNCCRDADIELIPGCHVPSNAKIQDMSSFTTVKYHKKNASKSSKFSSATSVRDDSTDSESLISFDKSSVWEETASSISVGFPELGKPAQVRENSKPKQESKTAIGSYVGAISSRGDSGSSRTPTLPSSVIEGMNSFSISQRTMDQHFPVVGGQTAGARGRGRGAPQFMKRR